MILLVNLDLVAAVGTSSQPVYGRAVVTMLPFPLFARRVSCSGCWRTGLRHGDWGESVLYLGEEKTDPACGRLG
jgi:hypothetical protein